MAQQQQQASSAAPVDANGATLLRMMALLMMLASSAAQSAAVSSGTAANKTYPLQPSSSPCIWQKALSRDGSYYSMEVCNVSDEFLESPMPENATAIDRYIHYYYYYA
jgi:hypothetical protein